MALGSPGGQGPNAPLAEINTTPLVDVMLVLFVIFLVTAPMLTRTVPLELPEEALGRAAPPSPTTAIAIDGRSQLFWNQEPVEPDELERRLRQLANGDTRSPVELHIDRQVPYVRISAVLAAAQRAGVNQLGFVMLSK
jgi:biopolymer transport protein ExbD